MTPTRFGMEVTGDPQLVFQIRSGRSVRPPMEAKIRAYLDWAERQPEEYFRRPRRRRRL
jgi:hypothetical protein